MKNKTTLNALICTYMLTNLFKYLVPHSFNFS
ncbi:hypothetical protein Avbf_19159, partial [Armadillidium vulgare]